MLNDLFCADVPLRNYSFTIASFWSLIHPDLMFAYELVHLCVTWMLSLWNFLCILLRSVAGYSCITVNF